MRFLATFELVLMGFIPALGGCFLAIMRYLPAVGRGLLVS